jgi:PAS domain S-box-containing protein
LQVDEEGRIILMNRVTEEMFGYAREELLGQPDEVLIPEELRKAHVGHRAHYRTRPSTRAMGTGLTLQGLRKDGSRFPVEISLSPGSSQEGFHATAIVRDITERKLADDRFRAAQERYTQKLAETNRELELRSREIERADRLKSEFLASMSHELRTPLHTIIGFSELLGEELDGPLNEKQKRFVQHIHNDSMHLLDLINDILDLSKIESGRLELRPEPFDLTAVVTESIASVRALAQAK